MSNIKRIDIESNISHVDHVTPDGEVEEVVLTEEDVWFIAVPTCQFLELMRH